MYRMILFDIGHVLVHLTGASLISNFAHAELSDEHINSTWANIPDVRRFETGLCGDTEFAAGVVAFYNLRCSAGEFIELFRHAAERKFDGVDPFLERLASDYELACLTNTNPLQWPRISEEFGLGAYFNKHYVSFQLGMMKPDAAIYDHVIRDSGYVASEILFVDDSAANCDAARSRGMDACHVKDFQDVQNQVYAKVGPL